MKYLPLMTGLVLVSLLAAGPGVVAQEQPVVRFNGTSRLEGRLSGQTGAISSTPRDYLRWRVQSVLTAWELPVQAEWLLTTEQEDFRQSINSFRVSVRYQDLLKTKLLNKAPWLRMVRRLDVGRSYPAYSPYTLSGVALDGINAEIQPGPFYLAYAEGRLAQALMVPGHDARPYDRKARFVRAGLGSAADNHLHVSVLHGWDKESILPDSLESLSAGENHVASVDAGLKLFSNRFHLRGEGAVSLWTRHRSGPELAPGDVPGWIEKTFHPNLTSSVDYAWRLETGLSLKMTRIEGFYRVIQPGFYSVGIPVLQADLSEYGASVMQYLFRKYLSIHAKMARRTDNLMNTKEYRSTNWHWGLAAQAAFPKMPVVGVAWSPVDQYRETPLSRTVYRVKLLNARASYSFLRSRTRFSTSLSWSLQRTLSGQDELELGRSSNIYNLSESIVFSGKFQLTAGGSWNRMLIGDDITHRINGNIQGKYFITEKIRVMAGYQRFQSLSNESRNRFQAGLDLDLQKWGRIELTGERYQGRTADPGNPDYSDNILRLSYLVQW